LLLLPLLLRLPDELLRLRFEEPLLPLRLEEPLLRPEELRALDDDELDRFDEPERAFDPFERRLELPELPDEPLRDPLDDLLRDLPGEPLRELLEPPDPLEPLRDCERCCDPPLEPSLSWSSSSPPPPRTFRPTATAAGTATPSAAPATTFFPVDMPSLSSISSIVPPSLVGPLSFRRPPG